MPSIRPRTLTLPTSTVGIAEYGDQDGTPVLYCHGLPGSTVEAVAFDTAAADRGVRIVAVDRPGIGASAWSPRERVVDWAETAAAVADTLGLGRFGVLGVSGGGPYALACAYRYPDRVSTVVLVSSPAPLDSADKRALDADARKRRRVLMLLRRMPFLAGPVAARLAALVHNPRGMAAMLGQMAAVDQRQVAEDPEVAIEMKANIAEAFASGSRGVATDFRLLTGPWGFPLTDIATPVHLWHGGADRNVPVCDSEHLAVALPNVKLHLVEDGGHLLFVAEPGRILDSLREPT